MGAKPEASVEAKSGTKEAKFRGSGDGAEAEFQAGGEARGVEGEDDDESVAGWAKGMPKLSREIVV